MPVLVVGLLDYNGTFHRVVFDRQGRHCSHPHDASPSQWPHRHLLKYGSFLLERNARHCSVLEKPAPSSDYLFVRAGAETY